MTKETYIDADGLINVSEGIIKQARKDFIKGGKKLYKYFGFIPTEMENLQMKGPRGRDISMTYDAWKFVIKDPYDMFGGVGSETVINQWKLLTIIDYYKEYYTDGATEIFKSYKMKKGTKPKIKELYSFSDEEVRSKIKDDKIYEDFIKARNYIYSLDRKDLLSEWDKIAYERVKKMKFKGTPKMNISELEYHKDRTAKKFERIEKAKELSAKGYSKRDIAKELGVTKCTVYTYLKS